ncbi:MAG: DUF1579 family protein [Acidimicrobiia bacterium]|jgi:hypothetical protein
MTDEQRPCSSAEARQFDFWLGEWQLSWPAEQAGGEPGERQTGTNRITRMFDDCVIEENFATDDERFRGHSVSVYDEKAKCWRQTWVDSSGGYLVFTGNYDGETMELRTTPEERAHETVVQRMVFSDITDDSLEWSWQGSRDGGDTWNDLWNISYQRDR